MADRRLKARCKRGELPGPVSEYSWLRTVRVRLALTYSGLLFGITTLILAGATWRCRG